MRARLSLAAGLGGLTLLAAGCSGEGFGPASEVFVGPAWEGEESFQYDLVQRGGDIYGTCTLETAPADDGTTTLRRLCSDGPNHDNGEAVVDSETLRPISSARTIVNDDRDTETTFTSEYGEGEVEFEARVNDDTNGTVRDLPEPDEEQPDPVYHDDESLLWLVRGLRFEEGGGGVYYNVNASTGRIFKVELEVERMETIEVPAGEFETWRVKVRSASITQIIWVEVEAPHRVIRAAIERVTYELTE